MASANITVGMASGLGVKPEAVCAFYNENWNRRIALGLPSFYRWQFLAPPECGGMDPCCVAVDDAGAVVGVMGLNRRRFWLGGTQRSGAEMTTYVVAPAARGLGIGGRIMRFLQGEFEVLLGAGITQAAIPIYMKSGFQFVRALPRFVRLLADLPPEIAKLTDLGSQLVAARRTGAAFTGVVTEVAPGEAVGFEALAAGGLNGFARDAAALDWRYARHPVFSYRFYRIEAAGDVAWAGVRFDRVAGIRIAHVIECFGGERAMPQALAFLDDLARANDVAFADFTCTAGSVSRFFRAAGWFSTLDDRDVQAINLFYPPELRDPATTSLMVWSRDDMPTLLDTGRLYVTKGDLDLDRPTIAFYEANDLPTDK